MRRVLDDPRGIAAASPVTATLGSANTGTLAISSLDVRSPIATPPNAVVRFNLDPATAATTYQISVDGGSTFAPAQPLVPGQAIALADGSGNAAVGDCRSAGTPADGDTDPGRSDGVPGGQQRQRAGAAPHCATRRWSAATRSPTPGPARCPTSACGCRAPQGAAQLSSAVASDAEARNSATSGVNLDEEAARLIQYQQSYQAAAKMLQVAQALFDTLLQVTAR